MAKEKNTAVKETFPESVFTKLSQVDVSDKTEEKNGLTYLSWAWAFAEVFKRYPGTDYSVKEFENVYVVYGDSGSPLAYTVKEPFLFNPHLGYLVQTSVTIEGVTKTMQLPVMDGANKAQKHEPYTYEGWEWVAVTGQKQKKKTRVEKKVEPATMFDINTTIMRCLVKNFAMHGLGHYIYSGEDLPEDISELVKTAVEEVAKRTPQEEKKEVTKKPTAKKETKAERPAEMPDDSAVLPSQPLAEKEKASKQAQKDGLESEINSADSLDELFEVIAGSNPAKFLAAGTMNRGWRFRNLKEAQEAMSKAPLTEAKKVVISLINSY